MPSFAPIVLVDNSTGTAVDVTYYPTSNAGVALFTDRAKDNVLAWPKLSARVEAATASKGQSRTRTSMTFPVVPTTADGCCVLGEPTYIVFDTDTKVSSKSSAAERASALARFRAWVASDDFAKVVMGESFYG